MMSEFRYLLQDLQSVRTKRGNYYCDMKSSSFLEKEKEGGMNIYLAERCKYFFSLAVTPEVISPTAMLHVSLCCHFQSPPCDFLFFFK